VSATSTREKSNIGNATQYLDGVPPYRYRLSLRIWHPTDDPAEYTREFGLTPEFVHETGKMRFRPNGEPLRIARESYWSHQFEPSSEPEDVDVLAFRVAEGLSVHSELLNRIVATGGQVDFSIAVFMKQSNVVVLIDPALQAACSKLGIRLAMDIYGQDERNHSGVESDD
jgi:hypothetical protein